MAINQDLEDINRIRLGDTRAFAKLVDRYKDLVFALTWRMLKNREEAEEAAQDTFVKAFKAISGFRGDSKFSTWVYRIAYNTCLDVLKKQKVVSNTIDMSVEIFERDFTTLNEALKVMEDKERQLIVRVALEKLPTEDSVLLTLYYFQELSIEEMVKVTGIHANNLKVKLFRSRKRLASLLKKQIKLEEIGYYGKQG